MSPKTRREYIPVGVASLLLTVLANMPVSVPTLPIWRRV